MPVLAINIGKPAASKAPLGLCSIEDIPELVSWCFENCFNKGLVFPVEPVTQVVVVEIMVVDKHVEPLGEVEQESCQFNNRCRKSVKRLTDILQVMKTPRYETESPVIIALFPTPLLRAG